MMQPVPSVLSTGPGNLAESDPGCIMQCRCIILASASKCMQITLLYSIITLLFSLAPSLSYFDNPIQALISDVCIFPNALKALVGAHIKNGIQSLPIADVFSRGSLAWYLAFWLRDELTELSRCECSGMCDCWELWNFANCIFFVSHIMQ